VVLRDDGRPSRWGSAPTGAHGAPSPPSTPNTAAPAHSGPSPRTGLPSRDQAGVRSRTILRRERVPETGQPAPALVLDYGVTVLALPGGLANMDNIGNLVLRREE